MIHFYHLVCKLGKPIAPRSLNPDHYSAEEHIKYGIDTGANYSTNLVVNRRVELRC